MIEQNRIAEEYEDKGIVRIRQLFSPDEVAAIRAEVDRYVREDLDSKPADACTREADGRTVRNLWRLEQHNDYFRKLADRPELTELVGKLVHGEPILIAVETFNKPARVGSGVPYHQDNAYFCLDPPDALTVWVAIDQVTVENGAVYFVEGSHRLGMLPTKRSGVAGNSIGLVLPPETPKEAQFCATLNPGDATIHHSQTIHHSDPNTTDRSRLGLLLVYRGAHTKTVRELHEAYTDAATATPPVRAAAAT